MESSLLSVGLVGCLLILVLQHGICSSGSSTNGTGRPRVVNVGSLFGFRTQVGKAASVAIQAAVDDVNSDPSVLGGTTIKLTMKDSNYSGFLGLVEALQFMEKDTVAIIGPQSSVMSHMISHIANELQVPLLSFAAGDPTLSSLQFPYFVRTSQNDLFQMTAIAEIVEHYGWREVVAIYVDDEQGRNGIAALGDKLAERRLKISFKVPMRADATRDEITGVLVQVALTESRIIVLHTYTRSGPLIITVARFLGMMGNGYVWIATNWLTTVLDTDYPLHSDSTENFEGLLTLRMYTPDTELKRKFVSRWSNLTSRFSPGGDLGLNTFGLYAYDTVWILAHALNSFFDRGGVISFSNDSRLARLGKGNLHLDALSIFNGGKLLLDRILLVNMTGVTGEVTFTPDKNLMHPAYEVINVISNGFRRVGYWSNYSGLSTVPPETLYSRPPNRSSSSQQLYPVLWPGQVTQTPRGWVFPNHGKHLKIGVPNRVSFRDFVSQSDINADTFSGYCIDVFNNALNLLPYAVPYVFVSFGNGRENPSADEMVRLMTTGVFDAVVGDIAITTNRTRMADFTQPYIESGLVVVAPVKRRNMDTWAFLRPFTPAMWLVTALSFIFIGVVVWILEHRLNDEFRGPPKKQIVTILWFSFSTWFFAHRENTVSGLSRFVLIVWLFVVLIINSSYTASLTSILTVQQLASPIKGIDTLRSSKDPIGYQQGSFIFNYLVNELHIDESRLVPLITPEDYVNALRKGPHAGGVAALIDERAYVELFLSARCDLSIIGPEFTKNGWGFAFPRDSPLSIDMSTAILKLSENGDLQRIHDKWLMSSACTSAGSNLLVDRLHFESFRGLFIVCGLACAVALLIYFLRILCQFREHCTNEVVESSSTKSGGSSRLQSFLSFVDEKEVDARARSKRRQMEVASNRSGIDDGSVSNDGSKRLQMEYSSPRNHGSISHV
ncbi:hypothetical protein MLD38_030805 [Melastoma candidum]|uniref:Uncharacterized protein n=1 Tax=Melastoma candidum TaxID=119954 RepID=A0ACB9MMT3_9MYRT|nr:hypothetical protein MLD38_030805 [Melastoma candidum]